MGFTPDQFPTNNLMSIAIKNPIISSISKLYELNQIML